MRRVRHDKAVGREAVLNSIIDPSSINIGNRDCRATRLPSHSRGQETNRAGSDNQCGGTRGRTCPIDGMDRDGKGFKESRGVKGNVVGQPE